MLETFLEKYDISETQNISGSLDLDSLTNIPEGFNPTVGGSLNCPYAINYPLKHKIW